jgi:hypothetical protein
LQEGVLHRLQRKLELEGKSKAFIRDVFVNIVAHIFTNKMLPFYNDFDKNKEISVSISN